jgi:hypothetical protein
MRETFPEDSAEEVTVKAFIFVIVNKMGLVCRESLPDYIRAIGSLVANYD